MRAHIAYLKKKKEKSKLKAKLKYLEYEIAAGFVDEWHQINNDNYACQLSLECSKYIWDLDVYLALLQH